MPADFPPPLLLLLHEGGWDEVIMVAAGLLMAYLVIVWTGRKTRDDDVDLDEDLDLDDGVSGASGEATSDQPPRQRS
jgi:hypothetical protein